MKEIENNKAITLISLIITIIVLLILAGISITALTGDNGLINRANLAKENSEIAEQKEILKKAAVQAMGKNRTGSLEKDELQEELDKLVGENKTTVTGNRKYKVAFLNPNHLYSIDSEGNIKIIDGVEENDSIIFANNYFLYKGTGEICSYTPYVSDEEKYDPEEANEKLLVENVKEYEFNNSGFWAITNSGDLYVYGEDEIKGMNISSLAGKEFACITQTPGHDLYGKKVKAVSMIGTYYGYAIDEDGKYYIWSNGQSSETLADGSNNTAVKIKCVSEIEGNKLYGKKIVKGEDDLMDDSSSNTCYVMDDQGNVYGWNYVHAGNGTRTTANTPICINEVTDSPFYNKKFLKFQTRKGSYVAIDENKKIWTWGENSYGELGSGNTTRNNTATCLTDVVNSPLYNKKIVDCGINAGTKYQMNTSGFCYAIDEDGKLYTWGSDYIGELGNGEIMTGTRKFYTPICINDVEDSELNGRRVKEAGSSYAIDSEGRLYGWGKEIGVQNDTGRTYPICMSDKENDINGKKIVSVDIHTNGPPHKAFVFDEDGNKYEWRGIYNLMIYNKGTINDVIIVDTYNVTKGNIEGTFYCMEDGTTYYSGKFDYDPVG